MPLSPASGFHPLRVQAVEPLTADSVTITFALPERLASVFRFTAGQHLTLRRILDGQDLRRTYSVCASAAGGPLRIAVKRFDGGSFSTWATKELAAGEVVEVLPPAGRFGPHPDPSRSVRYGLIAAGSGITPLLSIAATVLDVEPGSSVVLLYGNRTSRDVMFVEELSDLKDRHRERLQIVHLSSREEQESELLSGRIDRNRLERLFSTLVPVDSIDEWYVCGPLGMVTEARQTLLDHGSPAGAVHVELFYADAPPARIRSAGAHTSAAARVVVLLNGRRTTLAVERDGASVLDSVLAVRPDAPFACKGGVCGTCRARVTAGSVKMDVNYALEPDELQAGVVLTCQSHPTTPEVELEYL